MIHVRPIIQDDRIILRRMLKVNKTFDEQETALAMEIINQALDNPDSNGYTILCICMGVDSIVAGYICFGPIPLTDGCYGLYWILVDNRFTGNGLGTELLISMEEMLVKQNARRIYIETSSSAPYDGVRAFYERRGFRTEAVLEDFYRSGDDKIIYVKHL